MPPRDWRTLIDDILQSIARIEEYTRGLEFEEFARDPMRVDAVLLNLTIIGEAATRVPVDVHQRLPSVPWNEMRGMRNVIIHSYFGVRLPVIWETLRENLPHLTAPLQAALADAAEGPAKP
jgi:uncharacterized protein with HEPN domain